MTTTDNVLQGAPCWIDLMTNDVARSQAFYTSLFGWVAGEGSDDFGGYFMFTNNGAPVAGGMPVPPGLEMPSQWGIYLDVPDARKTSQAAVNAGAVIGAEVMDIADLGSSAIIGDPGGARIGLWEARTFPGFGPVQSSAGSPNWFELHTTAYDRSIEFYREVFGWDTHVMSDGPEFRYTTLGLEDNDRAGVMDASALLAPGEASQWWVYFAVDDTDAALAQVTALGGTVLSPGEDTPYGRLATAADPTGATFKLIARLE
jgi:uncharacterized protein